MEIVQTTTLIGKRKDRCSLIIVLENNTEKNLIHVEWRGHTYPSGKLLKFAVDLVNCKIPNPNSMTQCWGCDKNEKSWLFTTSSSLFVTSRDPVCQQECFFWTLHLIICFFPQNIAVRREKVWWTKHTDYKDIKDCKEVRLDFFKYQNLCVNGTGWLYGTCCIYFRPCDRSRSTVDLTFDWNVYTYWGSWKCST